MSSFAGALTSAAGAITGGLDRLLGREDETSRQLAADDSRFYKSSLVSFFELETPGGSFLYPLVYAPSQMAISEPYTLQATPTLDSGLHIEEGGVVMRRLVIAGSTGFTPHDLPMPMPVPVRTSLLPRNYSDKRLQRMAFDALSGQRHFEYLQLVFRLYSDLKIDPSTAADTRLSFHIPRDDEHWQVVPASFSCGQSSASPMTYPYQIDLLIVGPAAKRPFTLSPADKGVLDKLRDGIATVTEAVESMRAAVQDLTAVQGSFRRLGYQVNNIIANATTVIAAADNFVQGTKLLIDLPIGTVKNLFALVEQTVALYVDTLDTLTAPAEWPRVVVARFRALQNACNQMLTQPQAFEEPLPTRLAGLSRTALAASPAKNAVAVTSFEDIQRAGSANLPGDAVLGAVGREVAVQPVWRSVAKVSVRGGDTLAAIAQRSLGSPLYWRAIASLNNLATPLTGANGRVYTDLESLRDARGILAVGQQLLVPSTTPPPSVSQNPAVLGAPSTAPLVEQQLGRDIALLPRIAGDGRTRYGFGLVDDGQGGQDVALVAGTDNLKQGLTTELTTPQGSVVMYPGLGLQAVIGTGLYEADLAQLRYRVTQALTSDARVSGLASLDLQVQGDAVKVAATITAVGDGNLVQVAAVLS